MGADDPRLFRAAAGVGGAAPRPGAAPGGAADVLHDDMGAYSPYDWRFFAWNDTSYIEYSDTLHAEDSLHFNFQRGNAFWIIPAEGKTVDVAAGYTAPTSSAFQFSLRPQWNMVGSPFPFPVLWDDCSLSSDSLGTLYYYDGSGYRLDWATWEPWKGYWIYNADVLERNLSVPPREGRMAKTADGSPKGGVLYRLQEDAWIWKISFCTRASCVMGAA